MDLEEYLPEDLKKLNDTRSINLAIPQLAKDPKLMSEIQHTISKLPTRHYLYQADSRSIDFLSPNSIHLVVTSPPYWTLKQYRESDGQLGHVGDYDSFLSELDKVWSHLFSALVPGGRLICVVGDVCLSRRKNNGEHTCIPLHASIQEHCRKIGFSNLAPIIWYKIANASFEVKGGSGFLGKPYEPNGIIKNDIEYILMFRKPKGYRKPEQAARLLSTIAQENHKQWFQQIWTDVKGASTKYHPAPYPVELASRLIRMFSFVGDTIVDPFMGTGTTIVAAAKWGRNSVGIELDSYYFDLSLKRVKAQKEELFADIDIQTKNLLVSNDGLSK